MNTFTWTLLTVLQVPSEAGAFRGITVRKLGSFHLALGQRFLPKTALIQFPGLLQASDFTGMPISGVSLTDSCFYPLHHPLEEQKTAASASHAEPISSEIISCCLSSWTIEARFPVELCPLFQMFRSSTSFIITSCFLCPFHLARDDVHWGSVPWESKKDMIFAFWSV